LGLGFVAASVAVVACPLVATPALAARTAHLHTVHHHSARMHATLRTSSHHHFGHSSVHASVLHGGTLLTPGVLPETTNAGDSVALDALDPASIAPAASTASTAASTTADAPPTAAPAEVAAAAPASVPAPAPTVPVDGPRYSLRLHNEHTGESLDIVYRIGDTYVPAALEQLNHFLRDRHTDDVKAYNPAEFDLLHNLLTRLGEPNGVIDVVCGYRTELTNEILRHMSRHSGVAEHSQHIQAKAIDIRVPGVSTRHLRDAAMSLDAGGVGYYPISRFVHVDVGPVRHWTFARRQH
jgi:uncharacterized protein YcbK (DUF882 family)